MAKVNDQSKTTELIPNMASWTPSRGWIGAHSMANPIKLALRIKISLPITNFTQRSKQLQLTRYSPRATRHPLAPLKIVNNARTTYDARNAEANRAAQRSKIA
jgi:hypothetical protein